MRLDKHLISGNLKKAEVTAWTDVEEIDGVLVVFIGEALKVGLTWNAVAS